MKKYLMIPVEFLLWNLADFLLTILLSPLFCHLFYRTFWENLIFAYTNPAFFVEEACFFLLSVSDCLIAPWVRRRISNWWNRL